MLQKKIAIFIVLICLSLNACIIKPYKVSVQQGNILEQKNVAKLYLGMSKDDVETLLGEPVLHDPFTNHNRSTYIYTEQKNGGKVITKRIELRFSDDKLSDIKIFEQGKKI